MGGGGGDGGTEAICGPPPRVWGKRTAPRPTRRQWSVHPHACGENILDLVWLEANAGPPPRVWGDIFADQVLAAAILDRLLHFSTTINIRGQSYRLREQRKAGVFRELAEMQKEG